MQKMMQLFREKGAEQTIGAAKPLPLHKKGVIYAFEKGAINLFVQKHSEKKEGLRNFLAHFTEGLLFNCGSIQAEELYEVFAVSETELQVFELSEDTLQQNLQNNEELQRFFCFCLDTWIHLIPQNLTKLFAQEFKYSIFAGQSLEIPENQILSVKKSPHTTEKEQVSWISLLEGKLLFYGDENFYLSSPEEIFPLTSHFWFKASSTTKLQAIDTWTLVQKQLWQKGLTTFNRLFTKYQPIYLQKQREVDRAILESRKTEEKKNLSKAFKQIESVLSPKIQADVESIEGSLEQACQILANELKIQFVFPQVDRNKLKDYIEHLDIICEASHIRKRRVKLVSKWWKKDHGPLLGFYGEENQPIALIRNSKYRLIDLAKNQPVSESVAKQLSPYAYMFYPSFSSSMKTGKEVIRLIWHEFRGKYWSMVMYSIIGSIIAFFPPIATNQLFDYAVPESSFSLTFYLTIGLIFSAIGFSFFYFLRDFILLKIEGLVANLVQPAFWDRLLKLSPTFFRKFPIGNLFWRTMAIEEIRTLVSGSASNQVLTGIFSIFYLIIMSVYAPALTVMVLIFVVLGLMVTCFCCRLKTRFLRKSLEIQGEIRGILVQMIGGVDKLRVAAAEKNAFAKWATLYAKNTSLQMKIQTVQNVVSMLSASLPILSYLGIYFAMLQWDRTQTMTLANFLAFNVAFGSFSFTIFPLNTALMDLVNILPLWERARVILEESLEQTEEKIPPGKLSGEISINNVSFGYDPERPPVLSGISISIKPHEFIGIVGQSGTGKSTLIRLLLGFEKPQAGAIYYDGKDLAKVDIRTVRKQLGIVLQGGGIMAGSVYDNIACGGLYEEDQVEEALRLSGFNAILEDLPMGLHTFIQMNGTNLSGGQRQLLLLARALLGSPSILIFDEATSALDNQTQKMISHNIEELNVTRIVIAQRLSTIQNADHIYVIGNGGIMQDGNYEELANQQGIFAQMLARQSL